MLFSLAITTLLVPFVAANSGVKVCKGKDGRKTCIVSAFGDEKSDPPNIVEAFEECGEDATVVFPEDQTYWIAEKLHVTLKISISTGKANGSYVLFGRFFCHWNSWLPHPNFASCAHCLALTSHELVFS